MQNRNATSNDRAIGESKLAAELRELWLQGGEPSYRELAQRTKRSTSTINAALTAKRVPGWDVIRDLVEALDGDVDRFHKLYQLGRSERLELDEHADELSAELNMPVSRTQTDASTNVVSHSGSVLIQSGTPVPFNPLTAFAPAEIVSAYEAACLAYTSGAHMAAMAMARSLVEAVCVRQDASDQPLQGLITLAEKGVITKSLAEQGQALWHRASAAMHGQMTPLASDAADALGYLLALLSYVYIINRHSSDPGPATPTPRRQRTTSNARHFEQSLDPPSQARPTMKPKPAHHLTADFDKHLPNSVAEAERQAQQKRG